MHLIHLDDGRVLFEGTLGLRVSHCCKLHSYKDDLIPTLDLSITTLMTYHSGGEYPFHRRHPGWASSLTY